MKSEINPQFCRGPLDGDFAEWRLIEPPQAILLGVLSCVCLSKGKMSSNPMLGEGKISIKNGYKSTKGLL